MAELGIFQQFKGDCYCGSNLKEYLFKVKVVIRGKIKSGIIEGIDYSNLKKKLKQVIDELNGKHLNDIVGRSTKENISSYIMYKLYRENIYSVTIYEGEQYVSIFCSEFEYDDYPTLLIFNKGHNLLRRGNLEKAISLFSNAIELNSLFPEAYNLRGRCYKYLKDYEKAQSDFLTCINIDPHFGEAYRNLGNIFLFMGKYDKMIPLFDKAIELLPNSALAINNRGYAYMKIKKYELALSDHNNAIKLDPFYAEAYQDRSIIWKFLGKHKLAEKDKEKTEYLIDSCEDSYHDKKFY